MAIRQAHPTSSQEVCAAACGAGALARKLKLARLSGSQRTAKDAQLPLDARLEMKSSHANCLQVPQCPPAACATLAPNLDKAAPCRDLEGRSSGDASSADSPAAALERGDPDPSCAGQGWIVFELNASELELLELRQVRPAALAHVLATLHHKAGWSLCWSCI